MLTFIMLGLTVYMLATYISSMTTSNKSLAIGHEKYLEQLNELENQGLTRTAVRRSTILFLFLATLIFIAYYTISSIIIGEYWAAFAAATFSVVSVRNYLIAVDYFTTLEFKKKSVFTGFIEVLGLIYTTYFLYFYANLKLSEELFSLFIGFVFVAMVIAFIKIKNKKTV